MKFRTLVLAGAFATVLAAALGTSSSLSAAPQADLKEVAQQVRELQMQAGAAEEEAKSAQIRLEEISRQLGSIQRRAGREKTAENAAMSNIDDLARKAYMNGGMSLTVRVLMAENPAEFLAQSTVIGRLERVQLSQLRQVQTTRLRLAQTQAQIADREVAAQQSRDEMTAAQNEVTSKLSAAQEVLAGLQGVERRRLQQLAAQRRQQMKQDAAVALKANGATTNGSVGSAPDQSGGDSRAQIAVRYALAQVGEPYSFSANPPDSWDCSKLTTAAWGKAGVGITPLSFAQWDQTRRVPVSEIRPGDLVFYFRSGAHHVAIYIGNGKMVSASNPSDGVEIIDFLGPWYNERFSGVGRVLG